MFLLFSVNVRVFVLMGCCCCTCREDRAHGPDWSVHGGNRGEGGEAPPHCGGHAWIRRRHQQPGLVSVSQIRPNLPLEQRFSISVLAPPPRSAYFVCYSYRFRCLFYSNVSALRSGHHRIFRHDSSSKRTYIFHSKCIEVCKTWITIVYIYRGIWCHTRPCVKTLRSANPWMNVPK